jgi:uncharacterized membrane protein
MTIPVNINQILLLLSVFILTLYHVIQYIRYKINPLRTNIGNTKLERQEWVKTYTEKHDVSAVQALRNWIMTSTFLASTSILLSIGIINLLSTIENWTLTHSQINIFSHLPQVNFQVKLFILLALYLFAFFCFSMTLRYFNRAAFQLGGPIDGNLAPRQNKLLYTLNHGALFYKLGMRSFYISIPIIFGIFGSVWMFTSTLLLIIVLFYLDYET